jgi:hypothetical protein
MRLRRHHEAMVRTLVSETPTEVVLRQYSPPCDTVVPRPSVRSLHPVTWVVAPEG